MGNNLFGVNISGIIKAEIGPGVLDATLIVVSPGTRTTGQLTGGTNPTTTSYACKGFIEKQANTSIEGSLTDDGRVTIILLGDSINSGNTAPSESDKVTIEGSTYEINVIDRDPDAATYTMACSKL